MLKFILRRLAATLAVLFCVVSITFFLIRLSPGGPFDRERKIPKYIEQQLLAKYNLDGPLHRQYLSYIGDLAKGDLRLSTKYRVRRVNEILAQSLPVSFQLGAIAFVIASVLGIGAGVAAAMRADRFADSAIMFGALLSLSLPMFVAGPLLILVFALGLHWFPVGGWGSPTSLVLPAITLAAPYVAYLARLTRGSMLEVLSQDFIRTARAKGLPERKVVYGHALKVAILPVVSFLGPLAAHLLTGSIVVESVFNIPGCGSFFVNSILNKDGFLLAGVVIVYCALLALLNLAVDIAYTMLDKRIRLNDA